MKTIAIEHFNVSYSKTISLALDKIKANEILSLHDLILIKPNLVQATAPPVTTPVECCEAIINYIRGCSSSDIIIAEGCGAADYDTEKIFDELGYSEMAKRLNIHLIDLNNAKTILLKDDTCHVFREFHMPEVAMSHFIISVPVLKAHSLATITGTLKNMMGFAPPLNYQAGGYWKKSLFHNRIHESITDLNRYRKPDISVMDATVGLCEHHLGGRVCDPPLNKIIVGYDPYEVDRIGAGLIGLRWEDIPHLNNKY
ncbi:MAG: DUF362 domain-containing protein [Spirochaetota bacterium]|nr:DUF362 domain-containing protein [Spirochaetota bacterium]